MSQTPYKEGSTEAPVRLPLDWRNPDFYDPDRIDQELRRVFDICHGCRRCFNLCDSFPLLFDLIDDSDTGELDSVDSAGFKPVIDACTLCDMCFMTKCPYVPPHAFNLDFPHLMLRARAAEFGRGETGFVVRQLARTDRNGKLLAKIAGPVNWAGRAGNHLTRPLLEKVSGIDRHAALPAFSRRSLLERSATAPTVNRAAPGFGRKAVLYATCFNNYNAPGTGLAQRAVLAHNGVETEVVHPRCCGMPLLEQGDLEGVAAAAREVTAALLPWIDKGYDIIAPVPSCALMLKFEWPLLLPDDDSVEKLSAATVDISEYIVALAREVGLADGMKPLAGGVTLHLACHARAQNMGPKAAEMLRLIPDTQVEVIERCSGHGGSWGLMKGNFETALKVGRPVARSAVKQAARYLVSECPLAADHIVQGMDRLNQGEGESGAAPAPRPTVRHPVELLALSYGLPEVTDRHD